MGSRHCRKRAVRCGNHRKGSVGRRSPVKDGGLGYLTLSQPSPTRSGGDPHRIKLVAELSKVRDVTRRGNKAPHTLYVLCSG